MAVCNNFAARSRFSQHFIMMVNMQSHGGAYALPASAACPPQAPAQWVAQGAGPATPVNKVSHEVLPGRNPVVIRALPTPSRSMAGAARQAMRLPNDAINVPPPPAPALPPAPVTWRSETPRQTSSATRLPSPSTHVRTPLPPRLPVPPAHGPLIAKPCGPVLEQHAGPRAHVVPQSPSRSGAGSHQIRPPQPQSWIPPMTPRLEAAPPGPGPHRSWMPPMAAIPPEPMRSWAPPSQLTVLPQAPAVVRCPSTGPEPIQTPKVGMPRQPLVEPPMFTPGRSAWATPGSCRRDGRENMTPNVSLTAPQCNSAALMCVTWEGGSTR